VAKIDEGIFPLVGEFSLLGEIITLRKVLAYTMIATGILKIIPARRKYDV